MARTLGDIIELCKDGGKPTIDEARLAVCCLSSLSTFDSLALMRLSETKESGKRQILTGDPTYQWKESFRRWKMALEKCPQDWLGEGNHPDSEECKTRRKLAFKIFGKVMTEENTREQI